MVQCAPLPFTEYPHLHWLPALQQAGAQSIRNGDFIYILPFARQWHSIKAGTPAFQHLQNLMAPAAAPMQATLPNGVDVPFSGGWAGVLSYEQGAELETLPTAKSESKTPDLPQAVFGYYDTVAVYHLPSQHAGLFSHGRPCPTAQPSTHAAQQAIAHALHYTTPRLAAELARFAWPDFTLSISPKAHQAAIARTRAYIAAGDIFQANITARAYALRPRDYDLSHHFAALYHHTQAPFASFCQMGNNTGLISCSPERFLKLENGTITTSPIKGTRPRGKTAAEDQALRTELATAEKDRAENLMIVDLMRNDISRVSRPGSVTVPEFLHVHSFSHVHHLISTVQGQLRPDLTWVDLLKATFPGGSITGAPKIRAMEIIHELESTPRGYYCGCHFWATPQNTMDSSILIRCISAGANYLAAAAGGGIVYDSCPLSEYEELCTKLYPIIHPHAFPKVADTCDQHQRCLLPHDHTAT